jgi:hypothetical protein
VTAYMSAQEMLDRQQRTAAADAKAIADPSGITEADLRDISPEVLSDVMNKGQLAHLGIGAPNRPKRRH